MRDRYLFRLAKICHISALDVDALRYLDFVRYCIEIDAYEKSIRDHNRQLEQQG